MEAPGAPHDYHEPRFMMLPIRPATFRADYGVGITLRRFVMTWETPQAVEIRFGMEITMYVSNR
jgi:coenzyme PQQ precursor peptide PqqA